MEGYPKINSREKVSGEEKKSLEPETQNSTSVNESIDIGENIIEAEEIAVVESEFTNRIIKEDLSLEGWSDLLNPILEKHPAIKLYKPFFDTYIREAIARHACVNELWEEVAKELPEGSTENDIATKVFEMIFHKVPLEKNMLGIIKGRQSLALKMSLSDVNYLRSNNERSNVGSNVTGFKRNYLYSTVKGTQHAVILIIVYSVDRHPTDVNRTLHHENQHAMNSMFKRARRNTLDDSSYSGFDPLTGQYEDFPKAINILSERRSENDTDIHSCAKEEILAFLKGQFDSYTLPERDGSLKSWYIHFVDRSLFRNPRLFKRMVFRLMTKSGLYGAEWKENLQLTNEEIEKYELDVRKALDSSMELIEFYKLIYKDEAVATTISVLQKFPLQNWPGIVRLVKKRYREMSSQGGVTNIQTGATN